MAMIELLHIVDLVNGRKYEKLEKANGLEHLQIIDQGVQIQNRVFHNNPWWPRGSELAASCLAVGLTRALVRYFAHRGNVEQVWGGRLQDPQ